MSELDRLGARVDSLESELRRVRGDLERLRAGQGAAVPEEIREKRPLAPSPGDEGPLSARRPPVPLRVRLSARLGSGELEFLLGGNLLGKLGLLALVLAAGWFIKLAFDNRWINESGRIYTGLVIGFVMIGAGLRLSGRRFRLLGPAVTGAGFSILYIAFFGAFYFYDLVDRNESFAGLFLLSASLAYLAMRGDSRLLYSFSLLGAFMAPILLSSGENSYRFLFLYCMVVNLGFFAVSTVRAWRGVSLLLLLANAALFFVWFAQNGLKSSFTIPYLHMLVLHLGFLAREHFLFPRIRRQLFWDNHIAAGASHVIFFIATLLLANQYHAEYSAHFLLVAALAQIVLGALVPRTLAPLVNARSLELAWSLVLGAYLVWVFGALAQFFEGRLLSMSWVALAGALSLFAARVHSRRILWASLPLWVIALFRLLFLEGRPWDFTVIANGRFALFGLAGALLAGTYWAQRARPMSGWMRTFGFVAIAVLVIGTLKENGDFVVDRHYRNMGYSYVMALYALALLVPGFLLARPSARWSGMVLSIMVVAKLYLYDVWTMTRLVRIISFATLGVTLVVVSYYYQRFRQRLFPEGEKS